VDFGSEIYLIGEGGNAGARPRRPVAATVTAS
jgi:hypothetical protein